MFTRVKKGFSPPYPYAFTKFYSQTSAYGATKTSTFRARRSKVSVRDLLFELLAEGNCEVLLIRRRSFPAKKNLDHVYCV